METVLIPVASLILTFFALWDSYNNKNKKIMWLLSAIATVLATAMGYSSYQDVLEQNELKSQLKELRLRYDSLNNEVLKNIIGSGFPTFNLRGVDGGYVGLLINNGDYPIYNVVIQVIDPIKIQSCKLGSVRDSIFLDQDCINNALLEYSISEIPPKKSLVVKNILIKEDYESKVGEYYIRELKISTRTTTTIQQVVIQLRKGYSMPSFRIWEPVKRSFYESEKHKIVMLHDVFNVNWDSHFPVSVDNRFLKSDQTSK